MIMLCFFILLTSFIALQPVKITSFADSFTQAVTILPWEKGIQSSDTVSDADLQLLPKADVAAELFEEVRSLSHEEGLQDIQLRRSEKGVVMTLKDQLLFDSAQADFAKDAFPRLEKIARLIRRLQVPVEIGGHTDNQPIQTAQFRSNWDLSTARAVKVLRYLIEEQQIAPQGLAAVGFAEFHPVTRNDSPEQRAMNRRVEFVFQNER
jgi:chemotaxis protein MotB